MNEKTYETAPYINLIIAMKTKYSEIFSLLHALVLCMVHDTAKLRTDFCVTHYTFLDPFTN